MALNHSPSIITNGLVLYLDAANPRSYPGSGNTWFDLSGNGNNGTLTNGPTFNSANSGVISFDGVNDYVDTGYLPGTVSSLTINTWISKTSQTRAYLLAANTGAGSGIGFELYETIAYFNAYQNNTNQYAQINWSANGWYNWCFRFDGSATGNSNRLKIFINGVEQTLTFAGTIQNTISANETFRIGQRNWSVSYSQNLVSNIKIYNRALSIPEIVQNFNATRGRFGI